MKVGAHKRRRRTKIYDFCIIISLQFQKTEKGELFLTFLFKTTTIDVIIVCEKKVKEDLSDLLPQYGLAA